jgi:hypothetical protein
MAEMKEGGMPAASARPDVSKMTPEQRELMSQRLTQIAQIEASRAKVAELNKKLFDTGFRVDVLCW